MRPWLQTFGETLMWVGFATMIVGVVGEFLGWWNDAGVVLTVGGGIGSVFGGVVALWSLLRGAGQKVLAGVEGLHGKQDQMLGQQDQMLHKQGQVLGKQDQMLDKQDQMLDKQDQMLDKQDLAMERFEHLIEVEEGVLSLLDERLPRA